MKLNNTFALINSGGVAKTRHWKNSHAAIETAILNMSWPTESKGGMVIPRIVSIKPGDRYTDKRGKILTWRGEKNKTLRNGVVPLRQLFRFNLETSGWKAEEPLSLKSYFEKIRNNKDMSQIFRYPNPRSDALHDPLHEGVGNFDFWLRSNRFPNCGGVGDRKYLVVASFPQQDVFSANGWPSRRSSAGCAINLSVCTFDGSNRQH